ncbi:transcriptional regulator [Paracidobacterium acidisoli]|uniref:Transcriptional regulator n=1 Tax=Paracidobacterium acidisoli TaxID=2303751 RepID=A0A372IKF9_9BACT|nr:transcriptional regulator [Paracidobacterium acidisoli]MBT9332600.1 hypothetical protein [Paracidobacterium acidisoli]
MSFSAAVESPSTESIFEAANPGFQENFDELPFAFSHCFNESHPLFQLSRLRRLMENPETRKGVYYDAGEIRVDQRWDSIPERKVTMEEAFDNIGNAGAWMIFRRVSLDPDYNMLLDQCLDEVKRLSGRKIDEDQKSQEAMIFVTSPNRVTSYHIDRECNFLMQVRGKKTINVFDRNDRDVMPEHELETFWSKDNNAGIYKPEYQDRAFVFEMKPGTGVHIPVNSPHWLKNGDNISISFSISYQYKDTNRKYVYQANYYLRRMGFQPTPPGRSALIDGTKKTFVEAGLKGKKLLQFGRH